MAGEIIFDNGGNGLMNSIFTEENLLHLLPLHVLAASVKPQKSWVYHFRH